MYAKLINGALQKAPLYLEIDSEHVWNASEAQHRSCGYYPVVFTDCPDTDDQHFAEASWQQREDDILQVWTIIEIPEPDDDDEISDEDAWRVIIGEGL